MVLYYGLFALEAANNTIAAATTPTTTSTIPRTGSDRISLARQNKYLSNSIGKMPSSSTSSSNSWIYTEDLRKHFEERYADYRYVFVPVYIDRKSGRHSHSTTALIPQTIDRDNSWMYSRSLRDRGFYSTSKMSLPLTTNISSSACCVTNHGFMRDELPVKKDLKSRFFKRSLSVKDKRMSSTTTAPNKSTNISLSSLPFSHLTSSTSSFSTTTNNLLKHRTSDVVEEEDDEGVDNENHSVPLLKQDSTLSTTVPSTDSNVNTDSITITNELTSSISTPSKTQSSIKHSGSQNKKLTRLRSFFFRTSSSTTQQQQQQQKTILSSSSLSNRISRT